MMFCNSWTVSTHNDYLKVNYSWDFSSSINALAGNLDTSSIADPGVDVVAAQSSLVLFFLAQRLVLFPLFPSTQPTAPIHFNKGCNRKTA